jgi:hypothetical protein
MRRSKAWLEIDGQRLLVLAAAGGSAPSIVVNCIAGLIALECEALI